MKPTEAELRLAIAAPVTRQLTIEERRHDRLMTTRDLSRKYMEFKDRVGKDPEVRYVKL